MSSVLEWLAIIIEVRAQKLSILLLSLLLTVPTASHNRQNDHSTMRLGIVRCPKIQFAARLWMTRQPNSRSHMMGKPITFAV